ncbi:hypothetical protein [Coleofasciculus sp.]|uniref:hypothetical protein n=1 Tax=Coleofasciculus sp. TaxID=3100458 RepID=UPI003A39B7EA
MVNSWFSDRQSVCQSPPPFAEPGNVSHLNPNTPSRGLPLCLHFFTFAIAWAIEIPGKNLSLYRKSAKI